MGLKITLLITLLAIGNILFAQNDSGSLRGKLIDTVTHQSLNQATIKILQQKDSSLLAHSFSDNSGSFIIRSIPFGKYILRVSFSGYETRNQCFQLSTDSAVLNAGTIYMQLQANNLGNVTVEAAPIVIKKDTVEFNAAMFKTKPNASAEDVLKKLPGVDVDKNGNIKAQGETVQRVLVNGKRFFGDDPKMASKNLPQDIIDKIQVFDDLSDQSKFTGFDDGNRVKTINITTKKNMSKGNFGKLIAGIGNKDLYDEAANISHFDDDQQITLIAQANNTNKQNFTVQDVLGSSNSGKGNSRSGGGNFGGGFAGGGNRGGGSVQSLTANNNNNGLTTTWAGGINYRDNWGKNTQAYGSYFYNNLQTTKDQKIATENFYPDDSSLFNDQDAALYNHNINQRVNLNIETQFDSSNSIVIRPNVSWQQSDATNHTTTTTTKGKTTAISNSDATTDKHSNGYNGGADILYRHRFTKKGRTYSLDVNFGGSSNDGYGNNYSESNYILNDSSSVINQYYDSKTNSKNISTTFSYTEPVGKHSIVQLNYNYAYNQNNSDRFTYNYDSTAQKYISLDSLLTNTYENTYHSNRVTLNYRYQNTNLNMSIGSGVQFGELTSENKSKDLFLTQQYTNLYPTANLNYRFTKSTSMRFNYSGRTTQPNVQQLQPVTDNSDPMNIYTGNPALKQSFTNAFRLLFLSYDNVHARNMFASVNASFTGNNIVNATTTVLSTGVDSTRPINMDGSYNLSAFFNYGLSLKKPKSNLNFTTNFTDSRGTNLLRTLDSAGAKPNAIQKNIVNNYTMGETVKWTTNLKNNFDMNFSASPTYNIARYSVQPTQNVNYFSLLLSTEATWYSKSGWIISSDFDYTYYGGRAAGYNTSIPLWNASFAKQLFKNKQGELRLSVYDLLDQNQSITRNITENYAQDVQTKLLTRYVLLTFTYNLRNFTPPASRNTPRGPFGNR